MGGVISTSVVIKIIGVNKTSYWEKTNTEGEGGQSLWSSKKGLSMDRGTGEGDGTETKRGEGFKGLDRCEMSKEGQGQGLKMPTGLAARSLMNSRIL